MAQEQQEYIYTINSTDKDHYNRISANLDGPNTEYSVFQVTELTARCSILVLTSQALKITLLLIVNNTSLLPIIPT